MRALKRDIQRLGDDRFAGLPGNSHSVDLAVLIAAPEIALVIHGHGHPSALVARNLTDPLHLETRSDLIGPRQINDGRAIHGHYGIFTFIYARTPLSVRLPRVARRIR